MAQRVKFIDLSRSYLPIDPNTLPQTMHGTSAEDSPEADMPVIPYEGWNFMPNGYGWRSYFGLTGKLNVDAILAANTKKLRDSFLFQKADNTALLVVFTDEGVKTKAVESSGAWTADVTVVDPNP